MWGSSFPRQRFFGMTRNFPTFRCRKSISWTVAQLREACRCCASRSPVNLPSHLEAPSPASSRSIYKFGERTNAHYQPSSANEYLHERPLLIRHPPLCSCFFLVLTSLLLNVITSSFRAYPPLAAIHLR